jgi:hypothetical protein
MHIYYSRCHSHLGKIQAKILCPNPTPMLVSSLWADAKEVNKDIKVAAYKMRSQLHAYLS